MAVAVVWQNKLTFSQHITSIISKAKRRIYLIFKTFRSRHIALFIFAFKVYILPILDYCSTIWNSSSLYDIDRLEAVQRYYTKRLQGLWGHSL